MITSLALSHSHLFSLTNTSTLSVYNLQDFITSSNKDLPKIQSSLGISLRKSIATFQLPYLTNDIKFAHSSDNKILGDILVIYDKRIVIGFDIGKLVLSSSPQLKILFQFQIDSISTKTQDKQGQISTLICIEDVQSESKKLYIGTTIGKLWLLRITSLKQIQILKSLNIKQILSTKSLIQIQSNQNNISLIPTSSLNHYYQYICAAQTHDNLIYLLLNTHKILTLNNFNLQLVHSFDTSSFINQNYIKQSITNLGSPIKSIIARNSLLVLYTKTLLQFNIYTHTLTNSITLPISTLDITVQQSSKTMQTSLLMVGQCNSLYSITFPLLSSLNQQQSNNYSLSLKTINISSRLGTCVLSTSNNFVFVSGCDGCIDVFLNGQMHMMVLINTK